VGGRWLVEREKRGHVSCFEWTDFRCVKKKKKV